MAVFGPAGGAPRRRRGHPNLGVLAAARSPPANDADRALKVQIAGFFGGVLPFCLTTVLGTAASLAESRDWQPELAAPPGGGPRQPTDPITVYLTGDVPAGLFRRLAFELDAFDVTPMVRREGGRAVVAMPQPLETGAHRLRVVEYGEDERPLERASWTFEVRRSAAFRDIAADAKVAVEASRRLSEKDLEKLPRRMTGNGAARVTAELGDRAWRLSATGNALYNTVRERTPAGRQLDLGEYTLVGALDHDALNGTVTLGHQDLGLENLVLGAFNRRGVSATLATPEKGASVTAFALSGSSLVGAAHITGAGDAENRIQGAAASVRPIARWKDNLELTGFFYTGQGRSTGEGIAAEETATPADGWSIAAKTAWFDDRVRLEGEFARTGFDFDGDNAGFGSVGDEAYRLLALYVPYRREGGRAFNWTVGIKHEDIGTFFRSLANPELVGDRRTTSLFTDYASAEWTVRAQASHQTDNVNDINTLPTDRTYQAFFDAAYAPEIPRGADGRLPWYGEPAFGVTLSLVDVEQVDVPRDFAGDKVNTLSGAATLSLGASHDGWSWNLAHTVSLFKDKTGVLSDTLDDLTDVSAEIALGDRLALSPFVQWSTLKDMDLGDRTNSFNLGLGAKVVLIPDVLAGNVAYTFDLQTGPGDTPDTHIVEGELLWTLVPASVNRPGLAVALSGNLQRRVDDIDDGLPDTAFEVFTKLRLSLPAAY